MRLHDVKPVPGSVKRRKRVGCGESSGHGKTSTRGNKGQRSRSGAGIRIGFEGGQMPLHRRLPKKGFSNAGFKDKVAVVNLWQLEAFAEGSEINEAMLRDSGLVRGKVDAVKILGEGELSKKLIVFIDRISASAKEKIEKAGGSVTVVA